MKIKGTFDGFINISSLQKWGLLMFVSISTWLGIYFFPNSVDPPAPIPYIIFTIDISQNLIGLSEW